MNAVEFFFALSAVISMTGVIYMWTRFVYSLDRKDAKPVVIDDRASEPGPLAQDVLASRNARAKRKIVSATRTATRAGDGVL